MPPCQKLFEYPPHVKKTTWGQPQFWGWDNTLAGSVSMALSGSGVVSICGTQSMKYKMTPLWEKFVSWLTIKEIVVYKSDNLFLAIKKKKPLSGPGATFRERRILRSLKVVPGPHHCFLESWETELVVVLYVHKAAICVFHMISLLFADKIIVWIYIPSVGIDRVCQW